MGSCSECFAGHSALEQEMDSRTMAMKTALLTDLERVGLRSFDCWAEEPSEAPGTGMRSPPGHLLSHDDGPNPGKEPITLEIPSHARCRNAHYA
jgi:hypothetical protein